MALRAVLEQKAGFAVSSLSTFRRFLPCVHLLFDYRFTPRYTRSLCNLWVCADSPRLARSRIPRFARSLRTSEAKADGLGQLFRSLALTKRSRATKRPSTVVDATTLINAKSSLLRLWLTRRVCRRKLITDVGMRRDSRVPSTVQNGSGARENWRREWPSEMQEIKGFEEPRRRRIRGGLHLSPPPLSSRE